MPSFMTFPQRLFVADIPTSKLQTFKVSENMPELNINGLLSGPPVFENRFFTICDIDGIFFNNRSSMITGFQFRVSSNARLYNFPFDYDSTHLFANGLLPAQLVVEIVSTFKEYSSGGGLDIFDLIYIYLHAKNAFVNNTFVKITIGLGCLNNNFLNADVINLLGLWVKMEIADSDFSILPLIQARAYFLIPQSI